MRKFALLSILLVSLSFCAVSYYMASQIPVALQNNLNVAHKSYFTGCVSIFKELQPGLNKDFMARSCHLRADIYQQDLVKVLDATN